MVTTIMTAVAISLGLFIILLILLLRWVIKVIEDEVKRESKLSRLLIIDSLVKSDNVVLIEAGRRLFHNLDK